MPTQEEIRTKYKTLHDSLSEDYYQNKVMSKKDFDYLHGQNWDNMEAELKTASDYVEPTLPRDLLAEIDDLKARLEKLEKK